jgi:cell division transport system permease protein
MFWKSAVARAGRSVREDGRLYLVAVGSLSVAFLCLATALLTIANLGRIADAWGSTAHVTLYLVDGADAAAVDQLRLLLEGVDGVDEVAHLTPTEARAELLAAQEDPALEGLAPELFPASLEVRLAAGTPRARLEELARRVEPFPVVDDVETYSEVHGSFETLLTAGRAASGVLAALVVLCVFFVVASTIRLAIAGRRREIEVLKLCGASNGFVQGPFLLEGAVQGLISAVLAVAVLGGTYAFLHDPVAGSLGALAGVRPSFLHPGLVVGLLAAGGLVGAAGSYLSLRRYLAV